jgi:hypothetical protein
MSSGRLFVAPLLLGACVAVAAPAAKSVSTEASPLEPYSAIVQQPAPDQPGEPEPELKEEVEPKPPEPKVRVAAGGFTRKLDRAKVEARGAPHDKAGLDPAAMKAAATFDNESWTGDARRELLAYLRRADVEKSATFTDADARIVTQLQAGSGAVADGKLRDETMAVLFATGFRFAPRKAMPWEVRLDFYPADLEDLDGWTREIEEKVTKNGGSYRDVNPPVSEGSIYVHVGRSIVACFRARGGPPTTIYDDAKHVAAPTKPGAYMLGPAHAHVTSNWYFSQIPWGTEIRKNGEGYQYRLPGGSAWAWATNTPKSALKEPYDETDFETLPEETRGGETVMIWNRNDFGPIAWNLYPSDLYVHTTPDTEAGTRPPDVARSLTCSHGCVHIDPRERDDMMKRGYLGPGIQFVVRSWDEHLLPDAVRHDMLKGTGVASSS